MSTYQDIADIQARIATAAAARSHWRSSGRQEKYIEAHLRVETLELELDRLRQQRVESAAKIDGSAFVAAPSAAKDDDADEDDAAERERLMEEFSIIFVGRQYQYAQYRYDRLDDAVGYARKQRSAPSAGDAADTLPPARIVEAPGEAQSRQMIGNGIKFEDGVYHLGEYRYDSLADAMRYARLQANAGR